MKRLKKVFGSLAFLMFFLVYGTVGAIEHNALSLFEGTVRLIIFLALWILFIHLAGGFGEYSERKKNEW